MVREDGKLKSARRKPLRDVSNGAVKSSKSMKKKEKEKLPPPDADRTDEDPLDRILLLHADISSILRQMDELVVQAVNVKTTDKKTSKEINSFADVLSEIHSSLMPWVPKLQGALGICPTEPKIQMGETSVGIRTNVDEDDAADTPELIKQESLVSPSPLVSWHANCTIERGKQLFPLTPLPRSRTVISKAPASSKPATCEGTTLSSTASVSLPGATASKPNHAMTEAIAKNVESTTDLELLSPPKIPMGDFSLLVTPSLKNPPKSCILLEPDSELMNRNIDEPHKSAPFPIGSKKLYESRDSDSSSNEVSGKLGLKYPELIGIKSSSMLKNVTKALEASPAWIMSPPKCCTLLEPPDEKPAKNDAPEESSVQTNGQVQGNKKIFCQGKFVTVKSTPMLKGSESTVHRGKRPGETTLKRELWTKFEAATTSGFRLNLCAFQDGSEKGFLDRLEEEALGEQGTASYADLLR